MDWQGSFEIPGSDHKVGGRLVSDEGESLLRLYGSFYPREMPDIPDQIPLVWAVTEEGQAITLVDLAALGTAMRLAPGLWRTESWICGHAIRGHIEPQDPLTFSAVTCEMTYLSSWLPSLKPSAEHRVDGFLVDARPNSMGRVEHDGVFYEFHSAAGIQHGFDESTIRYQTFLTATPAEG